MYFTTNSSKNFGPKISPVPLGSEITIVSAPASICAFANSIISSVINFIYSWTVSLSFLMLL
mgnify:CR=1 FL=1